MRKIVLLFVAFAMALAAHADNKIDRKAVVTRHNPHITSIDSLASLTVGNGGFAFTVDATGLQTFPEKYRNGVPLGTMSDWGWHSFPNDKGYKIEEALVNHDFHRGHDEYYAAQFRTPGRQQDASNYFRQNPHRIHLGNIGLNLADPNLVSNIDETLDLWTGKVESRFKYGEQNYHVKTVCDPDKDVVASHIESDGTIEVVLRFPYPTGKHSDDACDWNQDSRHTTTLEKDGSHAVIKRKLDNCTYYINVEFSKGARISKIGAHTIMISTKKGALDLYVGFNGNTPMGFYLSNRPFADFAMASAGRWREYWNEGGFVDFGDVKDPRAKELERRVILSQYLMGAQECGILPPQETGLTYNSWFGKFHLEMILWHQAQFALWGHPEMLERSLSWYFKAEANARKIAERQGFKGVRWMKMTDPWVGEAPSGVGSFLIWQQPHLIYLAELLYRANPTPALLQKYARLVDETAEFMGDFADYDKQNDRYILRGCIAAQETLPAATTINPPFELSQWHCALQIAQTWRERLGKERNAHWDDVIQKISPLASKDSLYLAAETEPDTYKNEKMYSDHPAVMGAIGLFPYNSRQIDFAKMKKTEQWIWKNWKWETSWGWDYPMMAMGAARMGEPENAVGALLMKQQKNTYLVSGHNYQDGRLRLYLPGNGGYLMAVAMMCAGWDGSVHPNPGFPQDGNWDVKWEGLKPLF